MKNFIVYNQDGKILRSGTCADSDIQLQGELVIEGKADDSTQYISNGIVIDMPTKPDEFYEFDYKTKQWLHDSNWANVVKNQRNILLQESDWTQLPDVTLQQKQDWAVYRQQLRDVTDQPGYPFNVIWPTPPQG